MGHTVIREWTRRHTPHSWRGPRCARRGCGRPAWFAIHHVPVCSSRCAERLAAEPPIVKPLEAFVPVVRAVRWAVQGTPWTLVVASAGRRHQLLRAWWWQGRGHRVGALTRLRNVDVLTDAGLHTFLLRLVRSGATELRAGLTATPPPQDVALADEPVALARATVHRARLEVARAARVAALRARYRQRGVSQDGTSDQASRVA